MKATKSPTCVPSRARSPPTASTTNSAASCTFHPYSGDSWLSINPATCGSPSTCHVYSHQHRQATCLCVYVCVCVSVYNPSPPPSTLELKQPQAPTSLNKSATSERRSARSSFFGKTVVRSPAPNATGGEQGFKSLGRLYVSVCLCVCVCVCVSVSVRECVSLRLAHTHTNNFSRVVKREK